MKVHYLHVIIIDHDHLGADEVERVLEDANYPNDCIIPHVAKSQTVDVPEWDEDPVTWTKDDGFIGSSHTPEVDRLFSAWQPMSTAPRNKCILICFKGDDIVIDKIYEGDYQTLNTARGWMPLPNPPLG